MPQRIEHPLHPPLDWVAPIREPRKKPAIQPTPLLKKWEKNPLKLLHLNGASRIERRENALFKILNGLKIPKTQNIFIERAEQVLGLA